MFFTRLVVKQDALLQRVTDNLIRNLSRIFLFGCPISRLFCEKWGFCQPSCNFQHVVGAACVPTGVTGDLLQNLISRGHTHLAQPTLTIAKRPPQ